MPYSEAAKRNGSLRDFTVVGVPRGSVSATISPQYGRNRNHASRNLRTAQSCARSGEDEEDDAGADADESEADSEAGDSFVSGRNLSRAMGASVRRCVKSKSSKGSRVEMGEEIVVSRHKPSSSKSKSAVGRGDIPSEDDDAGPSNAVLRTNASSKTGSVQKTYLGPRKIKNASASSASNLNIIRAPGYNGFRPSRLALQSEANNTSDGDVFEEPLPLEGPPHVNLRKEVAKQGPPRQSSRSGAVNQQPSHSSKPSLQPRNHNNFSKNPFYASLTDAINGQRQQTLRNQTLLGKKPKSRPNPKIPSTPPQSPMPVRYQRAAPPRSSFACVLISPRPLPVPREQYKSVDEYEAEEETERHTKDERQKLKQKQKERDIVNEKTHGLRGPIKKPLKQKKQTLQEAIYVSSGSEVPVAGPSKAVVSRHIHELVEDSDVGMEGNAPIVVDATSEDQCEPSGRSLQNGSSMKLVSTPGPPVKRQRKKRRTEVIISSASASESNTLLVQKTNRHEGQHTLSPDLIATPPRIAPESASEQEVEDAIEEVIEPNMEDVAEAPAVDDQANANVERGPLEEYSHAAPSEMQKEVPSPTSALPEIVASSKPPSLNNHHQSTQPRSPTLCLTGTLGHLTTFSPSSRSTTLAVPEGRPPSDASGASDSDMNSKKTKIGNGMKCVEDLKNDIGEESDHQVEKQVSSSSDEEDDVCHRCRIRNVYAKMKCTKLKQNGVCQLHFCHRCCVVYFPKVEFDPYSATFVCPACDGTCDCINCCKKRGEQPVPAQRGLRWDHLGVELLLSQQETRRRERQEMRRRAGKSPNKETSKVPKRSRVETEPTVKRTLDIGKEAKAWIERQKSGRRRIRAFVGAWQEVWGPTPFTVHEMDGIDFDVHAANGTGKGKGRAVDPNLRLFVGDEEALYRPFVRADEVVISESPSPKKRPGRKRKQAVADAIYVTPTEVPDSKKRRVANSITIPEFTLNHQDRTASSSAASSAYHPTPDNFPTYFGLESGPLNTDPYSRLRYPGVVNDPMLGVINGPLSSDGIGVDMYAPDWDSVATKPSGSGDFAYEGSYDSYVAALGGVDGLEQYDPAFSYNLGAGACMSPGRSSKEDGQAAHSTTRLKAKDTNSNADIDITDIIDPALIEQSDPKAHERNPATDLDPDPDPTQFLTAHGRETALLPVPMIYGVPSSTGLSLQDLERTVHDSLSALRVGSESSA